MPRASVDWQTIVPGFLTWPEVDPARHAFDPAEAPAVIAGLPPAARVPVQPSGLDAAEGSRWAWEAARPWADAMSAALVERYGRWACGWRWATGEGDFDGGPIDSWCCPYDSVTTPEATLARVAAGLVEWREWLENLAVRFGRFLPLPPDADEGAVLDVWERAVAHLVTVVIDRTRTESGWYGHCRQVLEWFLAAAGIPTEQRRPLVDEATGGRFQSWVEPKRREVTEIAERFAEAMVRRPGA